MAQTKDPLQHNDGYGLDLAYLWVWIWVQELYCELWETEEMRSPCWMTDPEMVGGKDAASG